MKSRFNQISVLWTFLTFAVAAAGVEGQITATEKAIVTLHSEVAEPAPGTRLPISAYLTIEEHWHTNMKHSTAHEGAVLCETIGYLAEVEPTIYHLLTHMFTSISAALDMNNRYLMASSHEFRETLRKAQ